MHKNFEIFAKYAKKHKNRLIFHLNMALNILKSPSVAAIFFYKKSQLISNTMANTLGWRIEKEGIELIGPLHKPGD